MLAEPIQTVMRKYNVENAYEKLKDLTRGKKVDAEIIQQFVAQLDLPEAEKLRLSKLTPDSYLGMAKELF